MKTIKAVIGANFGDEGKGLMTDYFCDNLSKDGPVLNVRFNGGAQAGHTVTTPEGKHHVFSHFGAGSLVDDVYTYLSPRFIVNPILFRREYEKLLEVGIAPKVYIDKSCRLTLPQDMMVNQFLERSRGTDNHGSCGVGIYETIKRSEYEKFCFTLDSPPDTISILQCLAHYFAPRRKNLDIDLTEDDARLLINRNIMDGYLSDLEFIYDHCTITDNSILKQFDSIVFEGAQGLLLDKDNAEFYPHLTPSSTGMKYVCETLRDCDFDYSLECCYVSRSYFTRHGAGAFPTECDKFAINPKMVDSTNHANEFQGGFRYGFFDSDLFCRAIVKDIMTALPDVANLETSACFTHMNETDYRLARPGKGILIKDILPEQIGKFYISDGRTREQVYI